jgi:hypothetical protein
MKTKHNRFNKIKNNKNNKTKKNLKSVTNSLSLKTKGKKWVTAIEAAQNTLKTTNSLSKAKLALKKQALFNARKLFGSIGKLN